MLLTKSEAVNIHIMLVVIEVPRKGLICMPMTGGVNGKVKRAKSGHSISNGDSLSASSYAHLGDGHNGWVS